MIAENCSKRQKPLSPWRGESRFAGFAEVRPANPVRFAAGGLPVRGPSRRTLTPTQINKMRTPDPANLETTESRKTMNQSNFEILKRSVPSDPAARRAAFNTLTRLADAADRGELRTTPRMLREIRRAAAYLEPLLEDER